MTTLFCDLETYSTVPIKHGAHRYAEDAEVLLVALAVDDLPTGVWDTKYRPMWKRDLQALIDEADTVVIHNSAFDRTVLRQHGVNIPVEKIHDTMVRALAHSLPASLGALCDVLGVPSDIAKDKAGKKLIQLFTKPCPKNWKIRRASGETHPNEWQQFVEYARLDVDAMRNVYGRLPNWNDTHGEHHLWRLDQRINDRGIAVDVDFAKSAIRAFRRASGSLATRAAALTNGAVSSTTQRAAILNYLRDKRGVNLTDLTKETVEKLLKTDIDPTTRELLENRLQASATSPAKYTALIDAASSDQRLRGTIQFCGAARTGRDCLAEGTPVLVKDDTGRIYEKPIETVTVDDCVWDGESWVWHEGVVYSGDKNVVEHDGVLATTEHVVYVSTTESIPLGEAKKKGAKLWSGNGTQYTS